MEMDVELYNSVYKELVEIVGVESTKRIFMRFKGQQITFPVRLYNSELIKQAVIKEYNGQNISHLAQKYDYSERNIRRMLKDLSEE